jgi:pimeloyl-[acyl-carrier protein] synthase
MWNPLDPELAVDPYPRYAALRDTDPVYFEEAFGWWFVTGHEEAMRVLREPGGEMRFVEFQQVRMGRDVSDEPYCRGLSRFVPAANDDDHKRIRATFQRHFTPGRVANMRADTAAAARDLVESLRPRGSADLVADYAQPLPLISISALLAIPEHDQAAILSHLTHFKRAVQFLPMDDDALAKANATISGLEQAFTEIIARRREQLGDDLLSMLIREADNGVLSEDELIANAWGLFAGGYDTTGGAIATGMIQLLEHPEQLEQLRRDPSLVPQAVEELLRYVGPVQAQHRVFPRAVQVGDHTIPPDTPIICYLIAANRDPRWVDKPDALDVHRAGGRLQLAFGDGKRKCPGRHLARMTMELAIGALLAGLAEIRLAGAVEWDVENLPALMPARVPIAWDPTRRPADLAQ